ncbi:hypothetical protein [Halorussus marinus]|uniref:hypothetical protein n=1 Tax=Halorussus marinus TaxID=2505976 RepID=UPI0010923C42|nr:hypothetical protein [Halorussus marinus]
MPTKREVWDQWLAENVENEQPVPLFETKEEREVKTKRYGRDNRLILRRSRQMEELLRTEGWKVVQDWKDTDDTYEGLIYLMYTLDGECIVPRYLGKAGKYGRDGQTLSANLENIRTNNTKLARWGDGYAYHIGELSAAVLSHHKDDSVSRDKGPKGKYQKWADELFVSGTRRLREPVYFWTKAWCVDDTGPFYDFKTNLESLEYNLINLASDLYPDYLLNSEGA